MKDYRGHGSGLAFQKQQTKPKTKGGSPNDCPLLRVPHKRLCSYVGGLSVSILMSTSDYKRGSY